MPRILVQTVHCNLIHCALQSTCHRLYYYQHIARCIHSVYHSRNGRCFPDATTDLHPFTCSVQQVNEHITAIQLGERLRTELLRTNEEQLPNKKEILANLYTMLGLSYMEVDNYDKALLDHEEARNLAKQCKLQEIVSHAWNNIGRVHARRGEYQDALAMYVTDGWAYLSVLLLLANLPNFTEIIFSCISTANRIEHYKIKTVGHNWRI